MKLKLYMQKANVRSLGPYLRYGIWFYGCDKNCLGCIYHENEPLSFESVSIDSILQKILSNKDIEGVTISGGEPFLQNDGLLYLVEKLSKNGLGIILYTGKLMREILEDNEFNKVLSYVDLLIDGEYIHALDQKNTLIGSSNQIPYFLTDRYKNYSSLYSSVGYRRSEVVFENSELYSVGIPTKEEKIIVEAVLGLRRKNGR